MCSNYCCCTNTTVFFCSQLCGSGMWAGPWAGTALRGCKAGGDIQDSSLTGLAHSPRKAGLKLYSAIPSTEAGVGR